MTNELEKMALGIVIIAAGQGARFGGNKLLVNHPTEQSTAEHSRIEQPMLHYVIQQYLGLQPYYLCVVTGAYHDEINKSLRKDTALSGIFGSNDTKYELIHHKNWQQGMGSTIAVGVQRALKSNPALSHIMIGLADQPMITTTSLDQLSMAMQRQSAEPKPLIVASEWQQQLYPPMIFSRHYFASLLELNGDKGARRIVARELKNNPNNCVCVLHPEAAVDIDSPQDYALLCNR